MKAPLVRCACLALTAAMSMAFAAACSSDEGDKTLGSGAGSSGNGGGTSNGSGGTGAGSTSGAGSSSSGVGSSPTVLPGSGTGASSNGTGAAGNGTPEVCDGLDNDGDGIADNVDAGGDGICDCLNIGTIGAIGPWSNGGNIFKTWLDTRSPIPAREIGDGTLDAAALQGLDVIVSLRVDTAELITDEVTTPAHHTFSEAEAAALDTWVRAGGGFLTTIGYQGDEGAEIANVNRLLAPFGLGYDTNTPDVSGDIANWITHPISDGVTQVHAEHGVAPDGANGTVVARDPNDNAAMVVAEAGSGRVVVFGDEWITYDSEWADVDGQQVELLWLNMLKWLTPPTRCQVPIPPQIK